MGASAIFKVRMETPDNRIPPESPDLGNDAGLGGFATIARLYDFGFALMFWVSLALFGYGTASILLSKSTFVLGKFAFSTANLVGAPTSTKAIVLLSLGLGAVPAVIFLTSVRLSAPRRLLLVLLKLSSFIATVAAGTAYVIWARSGYEAPMVLMFSFFLSLSLFSVSCTSRLNESISGNQRSGRIVGLLTATCLTSFLVFVALPDLPGGSSAGYLANLTPLAGLNPLVGQKFGAAGSGFEIIAFSDPVCPVCKVVMPQVLNQAAKKSPIPFMLTWRQYPLAYHPHASEYSRLEIWAQKSGKFQFANDLITRPGQTYEDLLAHPEKLNLTHVQLVNILQGTSAIGEEVQKELLADQAEANKLGIIGTPFFIVIQPDRRPYWTAGGNIENVIESWK